MEYRPVIVIYTLIMLLSLLERSNCRRHSGLGRHHFYEFYDRHMNRNHMMRYPRQAPNQDGFPEIKPEWQAPWPNPRQLEDLKNAIVLKLLDRVTASFRPSLAQEVEEYVQSKASSPSNEVESQEVRIEETDNSNNGDGIEFTEAPEPPVYDGSNHGFPPYGWEGLQVYPEQKHIIYPDDSRLIIEPDPGIYDPLGLEPEVVYVDEKEHGDNHEDMKGIDNESNATRPQINTYIIGIIAILIYLINRNYT